jgi:ABC-type transport system involved in multi-copper enzyme maturation permease subunit
MLKNIFASLSTEILKVRRSGIFWITIAASCFISLMLGLMMILIKNPDVLPPGILKTKVAIAAISADWPAYINFIEMASGAVGIILFGFVASWIFGREYNDRTVKDILALPVSRSVIVFSKLIVICLWCALLSFIMFSLGLVLGAFIKLPLWSSGLIPNFSKVFVITTLLSILLCSPVAFVASAGRGYLPAIGFLILCMGLANFFGNIGLGIYFPWTIPMLYTGAIGISGNQLPVVSYIILALTSLAGIAGTVYYWVYADQSR